MPGSQLTRLRSKGLGSGGRKRGQGWAGCDSLDPEYITAVLGTGLGQKVSPRTDANQSRHLAQPSCLLVSGLSGFLPKERQLTLCCL